jgi:hypothetical protein
MLRHCCLLSLTMIAAGAGGWLLWMASRFSQAACEVPLVLYARVDGAASVFAAVCLLIILTFCFTDVKPRQGPWWACSVGAALCSVCFLATLLLGWLGIKIWGSVLLYGDGLWTRMKHAEPGSEPCDPQLYHPLSIFMIVSWTAPVVVGIFAALAILAVVLGCVYVEAVYGGPKATKPPHGESEGEEDEPLHAWAGWQGTPASWLSREVPHET